MSMMQNGAKHHQAPPSTNKHQGTNKQQSKSINRNASTHTHTRGQLKGPKPKPTFRTPSKEMTKTTSRNNPPNWHMFLTRRTREEPRPGYPKTAVRGTVKNAAQAEGGEHDTPTKGYWKQNYAWQLCSRQLKETNLRPRRNGQRGRVRNVRQRSEAAFPLR